MKEALLDDAWIGQLNFASGLLVNHISQFVVLWIKIHDITLDQDTEDYITWRSASGHYASSFAYLYVGTTLSSMNTLGWCA
jgi:hypothetical protein